MGDERKYLEVVMQACVDMSRKLPGHVRILVGVFYEVEGGVEMEVQSNVMNGPELARYLDCLVERLRAGGPDEVSELAGPRRLDG